MHSLRFSTFLTPAVLALAASPALAATTINTSTTAPLVTSAAGDVTVASGGSVTVPGGAAVTVDSANKVTVASGGTVAVNPSSSSGGILINPVIASTVENAGTISVTENFTAAVVTGGNVAAGPIANTTGRYGIAAGSGASGSITNTGTIGVKGLNSAGIITSGTYTGSITNSGTIAVRGDGSTGISTQALTGSLVVGGSVTVAGSGAQAIVTGGPIGGALRIQGAVGLSTAYTTDSSTTQTIADAAVNVGKAVVEVNGNVAGGISVYAPCTPTTVSNVPSCTSTGSGTSAGSITAVGNNPALQIGGATPITIGGGAASIAGGTYSLALDGTATSSATSAGYDARTVIIGGRGGAVTLTNGIGVVGTVTAASVNSTATAILIESGSSVAALTNNGTIGAALTQAGGTAAYGVRDLSGTLVTLTNHGLITATAGTTSVAVDLSANTTGVTVTQSLTAYQAAQQAAEQAASGYNPLTAKVYTATVGDIRTGSGNDLVSIQSGTVLGNASLGGGSDQVQLSGDAKWAGNLSFGTGGAANSATIGLAGTSAFVGGLALAGVPSTLTIGGTAAFRATEITGGSQLEVTVNGGSFGASQAATLAIDSLTVNSGGTLNAYINGSAGTSSLVQANTATFASGAKVAATIGSLPVSGASYKILSAGTLTGTPTFDTTTVSLPVLLKGSLNQAGNELFLTLDRKTATELGLDSSQTSAYDAIYAGARLDAALSASLLQVGTAGALQAQFDQLLPDHAGGVFDFVTRGSRLATRHLTDDSAMYDVSDVGGWLEPIYFKADKYRTGTADWDNHGIGLSAGLEKKTGIGNVGISLAYFTGKVNDGSWQSIKAKTLEFGAFWRISAGPVYAFAKLAADRVSFNSTRTFSGAANGTAVSYAATGHWTGWAVTGHGGASYKLDLPGNFSLKPMATVEYYRLHENAYAEGGSTAIELAVNSRKSNALAATTTLTAGWSAGPSDNDNRPLTFELEGGRRHHISGDLGATTAAFTGGNPFTITPDKLKGGWIGEARVLLGGFDYTWQIAGSAEQTVGKTNYALRASISMAF
ncbi:MAG: autotransporter outer membrane beta-barrel domain-containing protein [Pseudomonadota bacterium]